MMWLGAKGHILTKKRRRDAPNATRKEEEEE